jgi:hypothetical protein
MSTPEANFTWPVLSVPYTVGVGPPSTPKHRLPAAHHIERPTAAVPIATELDAVSPMRIIELGLLSSGEIPVANDVEIRRTSSTTAHHSRLK